MRECEEIFLALNATIARQVVVSLECPEPQEHLAAQLVPVGCSAIRRCWGTLQHSRGIIHFSLEITPVIHHSKVLKTTGCDY